MGPYLLMDKSTIQGLNFEEHKLLHRYYNHLISPILIREINSMLAKNDDSLEELKRKAGFLAGKSKYGPANLLPSADKMAYNNLLGSLVPMDGRIPIEGGVPVTTEDGNKGIFFDEPQEFHILKQWADGIYQDSEIEEGHKIRSFDSSIDMEAICKEIADDLSNVVPKFTSLDELVRWVDEVYLRSLSEESLFDTVADFILSPQHHILAKERWVNFGSPPVIRFAPYSYYYFRVNLIYIIASYQKLVKKGKKAKTHLDIQYLFYLPFAMVFTSADKELQKLVPYFLRENQEFITREELRNDCRIIDNFLTSMSDEETRAFYLEYGPYPPDLPDCRTSAIWKLRMHPKPPKAGARPSPEEEKWILEELRPFREAVSKLQT